MSTSTTLKLALELAAKLTGPPLTVASGLQEGNKQAEGFAAIDGRGNNRGQRKRNRIWRLSSCSA